ncbi:MAG: hypothetical protein Q8Q03_02895 [bacterium]|nr:hypothetical protein [bacterium]
MEILEKVKQEFYQKKISLAVMVDDYSFPESSFDYVIFSKWLDDQGYKPDILIKESQLIPSCNEVLNLIQNKDMKSHVSDYVHTKKYPCSLFIATWYLLRLGCIKSPVVGNEFTAERLINILPLGFKEFEDRSFEIIRSTEFAGMVDRIENRYFYTEMMNKVKVEL